jgi:hypothetical protein
MMSDKTVLFVHIPKTAGTTLNNILERQYPPEAMYVLAPNAQEKLAAYYQLDAKEKEQYRIIFGHMGFGLHEHLPGPYSYFTILREPIDRCVSFYYFARRLPEHYLHKYVFDQAWSLAQFVESGITIMMDNFQTRLISGVWEDPAYGQCSPDLLTQAKRNLENHFDMVGLTSEFDRTLLLLKRQYGWNNIYYTPQNVTRQRPSARRIDQNTRNLLAAHNQLDIELYRFAQDLFARRLAAEGADFKRELLEFRLRNNYLAPLLRQWQRLRRFSVRVYLREKFGRPSPGAGAE